MQDEAVVLTLTAQDRVIRKIALGMRSLRHFLPVLDLSRSYEVRLRRRANRFEPSADVDLGVSFSTEVPRTGSVGGFGIPLKNSELGFAALNHKPMTGVIGHTPADLASEFLKSTHAVHLVS